MRRRDGLVIVLFLGCTDALAQTTNPSPFAPTESKPAVIEKADGRAWSLGASAYTYFVPDDRDYVQPTFIADRGRLHLETRYNYENLHTASTWVGRNFGTGESPALVFTPIAGYVFGDTRGAAAGYEGSLSWRKLELYSEGEYVFDTANVSDKFFYSWSQLTMAPVEWSKFGVVTQRTRAYDSDRDLQRGLLLGFSHRSAELSAILFNPDSEKPLIVIALALGR